MSKFLTSHEMARIMSKRGKPISSRQVRAIAQSHAIGERFGNQVMFTRGDVVELINARGTGRDYQTPKSLRKPRKKVKK